MRTGFSLKGKKKRFSPDGKGDVLLSLNELERIEIDLGEKKPEGVYSGYMKVGETLRGLPVGSALDGERGVFYWQPGPAFYGQYEFVFIREGEEGSRNLLIQYLFTIFP